MLFDTLFVYFARMLFIVLVFALGAVCNQYLRAPRIASSADVCDILDSQERYICELESQIELKEAALRLAHSSY